MTMKRFFLFIMLTLKVQLLSLILVNTALAIPPSEHELLTNQVQNLLNVNNEMIDFDTVKSLSTKVINNHRYYSNELLAKVYLLSARGASNQGYVNQVSDFASKGLAANSLDKKIRLALLLKLADVYIAKKQYKQLLAVTEDAVNLSKLSSSLKYQLLSLSYRSVAFAMLGKHQEALVDLQHVIKGINKSALTEHIELLTPLALAYHNLGDYQTSLTMQLKILKLRFKMGQINNVAQTYLYLGYAYFHLQRFDDAYNAFWESKKSAEKNKAQINVAYADKALGLTLIKQKYFNEAFAPLYRAIEIFDQHNMYSERIEACVALASAKLETKQTIEGYALLIEVISLLNGKDISLKFAGFYRMVAEMYLTQKNYKMAYYWQEKHSKVLLDKLFYKKKSSNIVQSLSQLSLEKVAQDQSRETSKKLVVTLAENSELSSSFADKYNKQQFIIITLSLLITLLLVILIGFFLRLRTQKINKAYEEIEKPSYSMTNPLQIKSAYQLAFKKAKKHQYSLHVGYLIIENWQELNYHFNKKSIGEVNKNIASIINEHISEFDHAGLLNKGEYLILFEHENNLDISIKLKKIVQAVNTRSFANLGDFSITMKYSLNSPDFKDIDPYLFLARIVESVNKE